METQLTIKHLAAYLPCNVNYIINGESEIIELKSIDSGLKMVNFGWGNAKLLSEIKLILRPLSDLTKEIEVNGEKFVPIKKLFELTEMLNWIMIYDDNYDYDSSFKVDDDRFYYFIFIYDNVEYNFGYDILDQSFNFYSSEEGYDTVERQLILFESLFEWHFNVFNLPENLFVDINTLER